MNTLYKFNKSVVKTNFFSLNKSAVAFRLNPEAFCPELKLKEIPFGIFTVIGRDFNGFHVRFRDISRGGIRVIKSSPDNYEKNRST